MEKLRLGLNWKLPFAEPPHRCTVTWFVCALPQLWVPFVDPGIDPDDPVDILG
jgi:hypothetical protein